MIYAYKNSTRAKLAARIHEGIQNLTPTSVGISEKFKTYMQQAVPKLEKDVEERILNKVYHTLKSDAVKRELLNAYHRRKLDAIYAVEKQVVYTEELKGATPEVEEVIDYMENDIRKLNYSKVGKMFKFSLWEFYKYFPNANFGQNQFVERHLSRSYDFSIYIGKEAFSIIQHLMRIDQAQSEEFIGSDEFHEAFDKIDNIEELENYVYKDPNVFRGVIFDLGKDLRSVMMDLRFDPDLYHFIEGSFLFDTIVLAFAWQMYYEPIRRAMSLSSDRKKIFAKLLGEVKTHKDRKHFVQQEPLSILEHFGKFELEPDLFIDFKKTVEYGTRIPEPLKSYFLKDFVGFNSNLLLWGRQGSGKSGVLYGVTMWAYRNNWTVIKMPSVRAVTHSAWKMAREENSRLYLSEEFVQKMLIEILKTNYDNLKEPVNSNIYGFYSIAGVHDKEPVPVPNFYIPERKTYFYETDRLIPESEKIANEKENEKYSKRLKEVLPHPNSLLAIVNFGIENPTFGTNCLAELLEQLYNSPKPLLVVIDDFNWFFRPSNYPSFRYIDMKKLNNRVPAYHLALCRLFMKFDGHLIQNGFKLAATSNYSIYRHHFTPEKIKIPRQFCLEMHGIEQKYFSNFWRYCYDHSLDITGEVCPEYRRMVWMENQGNFGEIMKIFRKPDLRMDADI